MKRNKGQVFNKLLQDINAGDIPNVLLLFGEEAFLTDWAESRLVERFVSEAAKPLDFIRFEQGNLSTDDLVSACETMPMFSERKVVVIESILDMEKEDLAYLDSVPDGCLLIIKAIDEKANKKASRLVKSLGKNAGSYEFGPITEDELKKFIVKRFRSAGKNVSPQAVSLLIANCGYMNKEIDYALYNLENDIRKMVAYSGSEVITEEDVLAGLSDNIEHNVFKMLDAISDKKKDVAFAMLHDMIKSGRRIGQSSGRNEHTILATIAGQLELMLEVKQFSEQGLGKSQIARKLKVHEYRVEKALKFSRNYDENDLIRIVKAAFDTDERIKSGLLDAGLALEMLIAGI